MPDASAPRTRRLSDPAIGVFAITPDDAADLPRFTIAINVATPGTLRVTMLDGSTGVLTVTPGQAMPIRVRRVWQSGTTATGILGLA